MTKNILFSNSSRTDCWGGGEKWNITAALCLKRQGYNIYICCRKNSKIEQEARKNDIKTLNLPYTNGIDCVSVYKTYRIIKHYHIDLIICSTNLDIKLAGLAAKLATTPVISRQGLALISNKFKYRVLIKYFTTSIITNTKSIKEEYESYSWFPKNHIEVIYNGVEIDNTPIKPETIENLKQTHHLQADEKIVLSAGRLDQQKGFSYLIETAHIAQKQQKKWKFLIIGCGDLEVELSQQIEDLGLKNISLIGFHSNVRDYYALADVFVLSSLKEGTPNVVMEAMANKVPIIATNVNGVTEILENNTNGLIVPPREPEMMFEALDQLFSTTGLSEKLISNAYQVVSEQFSISKFSTIFLAYINRIMEEYTSKHL